MSYEGDLTRGLNKEELTRGFSFAIDGASDTFVRTLAVEVDEKLPSYVEDEHLREQSGLEPIAYALDASVIGGGGAAFLWEDVLSAGDAYELLSPLLKGLPPDEAARALVGVVLFWRRLRGVRVMLDEQEFVVPRAVKKGQQSIQAIADQTRLAVPVVQEVVERLKAAVYRDAIYLLEGDDGNFTTRF